jgi:hypothetical protein
VGRLRFVFTKPKLVAFWNGMDVVLPSFQSLRSLSGIPQSSLDR